MGEPTKGQITANYMRIVGPHCCIRCDFKCAESEEMTEHLNSNHPGWMTEMLRPEMFVQPTKDLGNQPKDRAQELAEAIKIVEASGGTHVHWAERLEASDPNEVEYLQAAKEHIGDAKVHRGFIAGYDLVLRVLRNQSKETDLAVTTAVEGCAVMCEDSVVHNDPLDVNEVSYNDGCNDCSDAIRKARPSHAAILAEIERKARLDEHYNHCSSMVKHDHSVVAPAEECTVFCPAYKQLARIKALEALQGKEEG